MKTLFILIIGFLLIYLIIFSSYIAIEVIIDNKYIKYSLLFEKALLDSLYPYFALLFLGCFMTPKK